MDLINNRYSSQYRHENAEKIPKNWAEYDKIIQELEEKLEIGTSDAQGILDARILKAGYDPVTLKKKK